MPAATLPFTRDEYASRVAKTGPRWERWASMRSSFSGPVDMGLLNGLTTAGRSTFHQAVDPHDERQPIWFGQDQERPPARFRTTLARGKTAHRLPRPLRSNPRDATRMDYLFGEIGRERGSTRPGSAWRLDNYWFSAGRPYAACRRGLPDARFFLRRHRPRELASAGEIRPRPRLHAPSPRASSRRMHGPHLRGDRAGMPKVLRSSPRSTTRALRLRRRDRRGVGDYPRHRCRFCRRGRPPQTTP